MVDKNGDYDGWEHLWGITVAALILFVSVFTLIMCVKYFMHAFGISQ